jgi:hypothetical protein
VYKDFARTIKGHLDREMKKRSCECLCWDASFKASRHLHQYHGQGIFKALITATNERGEIRMQFDVVTDGHDQFGGPLAELLKTLTAYGHPHPSLLFTDNPSKDDAYFKSRLPSLQTAQEEFNRLASSPIHELAPSDVDDGAVTVVSTVSDIKVQALSLHRLLKDLPPGERVLALDTEWDTESSSHGMVYKSHPVAVIQLGYNEPGEGPRALLLQVRGKALPMPLIDIFKDPTITFTGRCVGADIARIGKDFNCKDEMSGVARIDLDTLAKNRGIVTGRSCTLEWLAEERWAWPWTRGPCACRSGRRRFSAGSRCATRPKTRSSRCASTSTSSRCRT